MNETTGPWAEYYRETKLAQLEDSEGEIRTFLVTADYKVDELGVHVERYEFSPYDSLMKESVEDWLGI